MKWVSAIALRVADSSRPAYFFKKSKETLLQLDFGQYAYYYLAKLPNLLGFAEP